MIRRITLVVTISFLAVGFVHADDEHPSADAVNETLQLAETILEHHVLAPTRQEMLLGALRHVFRESRESLPLDLGRRLSDVASREDLRSMMMSELDALLNKGGIDAEKLEVTLREGLFAVVPGEVRLVNAENERVNAQFRSNRYVGTGIQLSMQDRVPTMVRVFENGPAHQVGARDGDRIEAIEEESTQGMSLERVVELLRGPEGTDVVVTLRQPDEEEQRVLTITRGVVPMETVSGYELHSAGPKGVVAYLRIDRISASCVHELEVYAEKLERDGVHGLILDLRFTAQGDVHHAVLLADALLDGKEIGNVRTLNGDHSYVAEPGSLFPDLKLGVLVGRSSRGTVEWLAAALQESRQALVFGESTPGDAFALEAIETTRDDQVLTLPTILLQRAHGRNLLHRMPLHILSRQSAVLAGQTPPWGVRPDFPLPNRSGEQIAAMPPTAARQLFNPPPRPVNNLFRLAVPRQENSESEEGSPSDD